MDAGIFNNSVLLLWNISTSDRKVFFLVFVFVRNLKSFFLVHGPLCFFAWHQTIFANANLPILWLEDTLAFVDFVLELYVMQLHSVAFAHVFAHVPLDSIRTSLVFFKVILFLVSRLLVPRFIVAFGAFFLYINCLAVPC